MSERRWDTDKITGIFGGSFDPVHKGHIQIASNLIELGHVQQIIFIPAAQAPHKQSQMPAPDHHRLEMLRLAIAERPDLFISTFELQRGGLSYTIHTAEHFAEIFHDKLRILIGMDSLVDLHLWYESAKLVEIADFITYRRPDSPMPDKDQLIRHFGEKSARMLLDGIVSAQEYDISSTMVRHQCRAGISPHGLLPEPVSKYIINNGLYQEAETQTKGEHKNPHGNK